MHEGVDPANEGPVSAGVVLAGAPADHGHHGVMVDMEEGNLAIVLAEHEEDGVQQLSDLGQVVHIDDTGFTVGLGGSGPVHRLAAPTVVLPDDDALVDHPHAQSDLEEVVDQEGAFQLEGFAILHETGSPVKNKE